MCMRFLSQLGSFWMISEMPMNSGPVKVVPAKISSQTRWMRLALTKAMMVSSVAGSMDVPSGFDGFVRRTPLTRMLDF